MKVNSDNKLFFYNCIFIFHFKELPDKLSVHWEYRNPKDPLTIVPLVPRSNKPHIILPGVYTFDCNYGPDRNKPNKCKWADQKAKDKNVDHSQMSSVSKLIIQ